MRGIDSGEMVTVRIDGGKLDEIIRVIRDAADEVDSFILDGLADALSFGRDDR